ncbi:VCBS repeat-containing protein [Tessaracoccus sp. SD287]|uniref:FG-GAP repeat domain-containing protein n=1 Tax=Tessaracoccus sp. SD287 TaxID=2782008 RepID=UPI001A958AFC|nr:VCBS repeat-containing protein [Tessaracoccus sp. SD287]MBO1030478.1 VCBS repeat-containing protein [Tessaracoccus sp. SD287]
MTRTHFGRTLLRRLGSATLGLTLALGLGLASSQPAKAAVPQPGNVPWVNFADGGTQLGVSLLVNYPQQMSGHWRTHVKVCNYTGAALPVGTYTFSYTNYNYGTFFFTEWTDSLPNSWLANNACVSGDLMSTEEPLQMAFHKILSGQTRIDILPATEWEGILKVREPKSPGTSYVHGDYSGDSRADLNGSFGFNFYTFRTVTPSLEPVSFHMSDVVGPSITWMSKLPDMDVNGASDLLVRTTDGKMHFQRMMDVGKRGFSNQVGTNWNGISIMAVVNKRSTATNQHPWLLGRAANGDLIRYQVSPTGIYSAAKIGQHWNAIAKIFSVGDFSGDGTPDLMAIGTNGLLYRYNMTATGNISSVNVVGHGWATFLHAVSPGDMNGDGRWDLVGVRSDGKMFFYANAGPGRWSSARQIDQNWDGIQTLA